MSNGNTSVSLMEIARRSWNEGMLTAPTKEALESRPLMVFASLGYPFEDIDSENKDLAQAIRENLELCAERAIESVASFSSAIAPDDNTGVFFYLVVNADGDEQFSTFWDGSTEFAGPHGGSIKALMAAHDFEEMLREHGDSATIEVFTVLVLPDPDEQSVSLETVHEVTEDYDGRAVFVDPSEGTCTLQNWNNGELDSGILVAADNDLDEDDYITDETAVRGVILELWKKARES